MRRGAFSWQKFIYSQLFVVVGFIILGALTFNWARMLSRDYKVQSEIKRMEAEVTRLEAEHQKLADFNNFLQTDFFTEQEIRKNLGYVLPGEKVVILEGDDKGNKEATASAGQSLSNPEKWWQYFFGVI